MTYAPEDWMSEAKCLDLDSNPGPFGEPSEADRLFFPLDANNNWHAVRYCHGKNDKKPCPVIAECLEYALRTDTRHGVWGGMTPNKRGKLAGIAAETA